MLKMQKNFRIVTILIAPVKNFCLNLGRKHDMILKIDVGKNQVLPVRGNFGLAFFEFPLKNLIIDQPIF